MKKRNRHCTITYQKQELIRHIRGGDGHGSEKEAGWKDQAVEEAKKDNLCHILRKQKIDVSEHRCLK